MLSFAIFPVSAKAINLGQGPKFSKDNMSDQKAPRHKIGGQSLSAEERPLYITNNPCAFYTISETNSIFCGEYSPDEPAQASQNKIE